MKGIELEANIRKIGITIENLAKECRVSRTAIYNWFKMDEVKSDNIYLIEEALGVNFSDIKSINAYIESKKENQNIIQEEVALYKTIEIDMVNEIKFLKDKVAALEIENDILNIKYQRLLDEKFGL